MRARHVMPSSWVRAARKGLANTRSSLAAQQAEHNKGVTIQRRAQDNQPPGSRARAAAACLPVQQVRRAPRAPARSGGAPARLPSRGSTHLRSGRACTPLPSQTGAARGPGCGAPASWGRVESGEAWKGWVAFQRAATCVAGQGSGPCCCLKCTPTQSRVAQLHERWRQQAAGQPARHTRPRAGGQAGEGAAAQRTFCTSCARSRVYASSDRLMVFTFMAAGRRGGV